MEVVIPFLVPNLGLKPKYCQVRKPNFGKKFIVLKSKIYSQGLTYLCEVLS